MARGGVEEAENMVMMALEGRKKGRKMSSSLGRRGRRERERAQTHLSSCFPDLRIWVFEESDEGLSEEAESEGRTLGSNVCDDEDGLEEKEGKGGRERRELARVSESPRYF